MTQLTQDRLHTDDDLIRQCYRDHTQRDGQLATCERAAHVLRLDLPALAGAIGRRLRDAGIPVTASQCEHYARSLSLTQPGSLLALYWTTRAVFVTGPLQLATFDRVFEDIFDTGR